MNKSVFVLITSAFVSLVSFVGCANQAETAASTAGAAGSSSSGTSMTCIPGESRGCNCSDGRSGAQVCDSDGEGFGSCTCSGSSSTSGGGGSTGTSTSTSTSSSGSSTEPCSAADYRTVWPHYRPNDAAIASEIIHFRWWGTFGERDCEGHPVDATASLEDMEFTCLIQECPGATVTLSVEMPQGATGDWFALDVCDDPGKQCDGKGANCVNVIGGSNAAIWVNLDEPHNGKQVWLTDNQGHKGQMDATADNLSCTTDGVFTVN